jgi:hypothetical protein
MGCLAASLRQSFEGIPSFDTHLSCYACQLRQHRRAEGLFGSTPALVIGAAKTKIKRMGAGGIRTWNRC